MTCSTASISRRSHSRRPPPPSKRSISLPRFAGEVGCGLPFPPALAVGRVVPSLEPLLAFAVLAGAALALAATGMAGYRLAKRRAAPHRAALQIIGELTPEGLKQQPSASPDKHARTRLTRLT